MKRTPFTLKSGNATAFKNMGSYSPMMQTDATTTAKKTGLGKLLGDVKSLVQNVGTKLKEGQVAANARKKEREEKDKTRTGLDRMNRKGKSQWRLDQMDAAQARKDAKAKTVVENGDETSEDGATEVVTPEVVTPEVKTPKGHHFTFSGHKGDPYKYRYRSDDTTSDGSGWGYEFQRPNSDSWEEAKPGKGKDAIHKLWVNDDMSSSMTPFYKKSPLEKGIGKYAKKAKGSRGYKMNK